MEQKPYLKHITIQLSAPKFVLILILTKNRSLDTQNQIRLTVNYIKMGCQITIKIDTLLANRFPFKKKTHKYEKSFLSLVALSLLLIIISCNKGKAGDGKTGAEKSDTATTTTTEKLKPLTIDTVDFNKEWWLLATMTPRVDGL
jgi:hypothetical protein